MSIFGKIEGNTIFIYQHFTSISCTNFPRFNWGPVVALQPERPIHTGVNVETVRIGLFENAIGALGGNPIFSLKNSEGTSRERATTALCSPKPRGTKRTHSGNPVRGRLSFSKNGWEQYWMVYGIKWIS